MKNPSSEFGAALDFGYYFSFAYIELQYYTNTLAPKISPLEFALGTSMLACPDSAGITCSSDRDSISGCDCTVDDSLIPWTTEPGSVFDYADWLYKEGKIDTIPYGSYYMIPLINDGYIS